MTKIKGMKAHGKALRKSIRKEMEPWERLARKKDLSNPNVYMAAKSDRETSHLRKTRPWDY